LEGKKVENPPEALQIYELCREFGCLPSQLEQEDNKTIEELICVMNAINEYHSRQNRRENRKELARKLGGGQRR
jgi:hypothetical protein